LGILISMPAAVDRCVRRILPRIRQQYPNKTPEEQRQIAWATCRKRWNEGRLTRDGEDLKL